MANSTVAPAAKELIFSSKRQTRNNSASMYHGCEDDNDKQDPDFALQTIKPTIKKTRTATKKALTNRKVAHRRGQPTKAESVLSDLRQDLEKESTKTENALERYTSKVGRKLDQVESQIWERDREIAELVGKLSKVTADAERDLEMDDKIRTDFTDLMKKVRNWSIAWAIPGDANEDGGLVQRAAYRLLVEDAKSPSAAPKYLHDAVEGLVSIDVLVHTALAHYLATEIFTDLFFLLGHHPEAADQPWLKAEISKLYKIGVAVDPKKADIWLSQTLTMLHPKGREAYDYKVLDHGTMDKVKEWQYQCLTKSFLGNENLRFLLNQAPQMDASKCQKDLLSIITMAGDLALRLNVQNVHISMFSRDVLKNRAPSQNTDFVYYHPASASDPTDRNSRRHPIELVIEPGIVAVKREDGIRSRKETVWSKAMLWFKTQDNSSASRLLSETQKPLQQCLSPTTKRGQVPSSGAGKELRNRTVPEQPQVGHGSNHQVVSMYNLGDLEEAHRFSSSEAVQPRVPPMKRKLTDAPESDCKRTCSDGYHSTTLPTVALTSTGPAAELNQDANMQNLELTQIGPDQSQNATPLQPNEPVNGLGESAANAIEVHDEGT